MYYSVRCRRNVTKYRAVYKTGTGRRGRGHWDACVETFGTWKRETKDLGTSIMGRGDLWDGDAGRQIRGRGDVKYGDAGM